MMNTSPSASPEMDALLRDAAHGDEAAVRCLLERHRDRLRRMIAMRLDKRLAPRLDPSDVVQETLSDAARQVAGVSRQPAIAVFCLAVPVGRRSAGANAPGSCGVGGTGDWAGGAHRRAAARRGDGKAARRPDGGQ